jgi:hypothetical protein
VKGGVLATKIIKVSDLTGEEIGGEEYLAKIVVEEHPNFSDPVTLEVLAEEIEDRLPEEQNFVRVTYYPSDASGGEERTFVLSVEEFNNLSADYDMDTVLTEALREQKEREGSRRGRRGGEGANGLITRALSTLESRTGEGSLTRRRNTFGIT